MKIQNAREVTFERAATTVERSHRPIWVENLSRAMIFQFTDKSRANAAYYGAIRMGLRARRDGFTVVVKRNEA